jgi:hypothetical protein
VKNADDHKVEGQLAQFTTALTRYDRVNSAADYTFLAKSLIEVKRAAKYIEARKAEITQPAESLRKTAKEWFGGAEKHVATAETRIKELLVDYIERRIPEASEHAREVFERGDVLALADAMVAVPHVDGVQIRNDLDFEVTNIGEVPHEFLVTEVSRKEVLKALKAGRTIPGIVAKPGVSIAISLPKSED